MPSGYGKEAYAVEALSFYKVHTVRQCISTYRHHNDQNLVKMRECDGDVVIDITIHSGKRRF